MPELPEVERARALVEARALDRRIAEIDDADGWVCRPHGPGEIAEALRGRTLTKALRRGKSMWFETDGGDGPDLGVHLGMAGRIVVDDVAAGDRLVGPDGDRWDRFRIFFEDGGMLALRDKRRLGRVRLQPDLTSIGPDAALVSRDEFRARVGRGGAPLKARIMDQAVIAGVGNLLADEALWQARLSPLRPAGSLSVSELDRLRRAIRAAVRSAVKRGGVHTGTLIAHRERGGVCPRDGAELERATIGGRTTYWCPVEQV
ncbi:MAG: formamidopyrimidine-DNA glycosylase [Solirubrobacteraceae bacterium]|nr:formamidopyrimidine-DNA glycosylase [Solirubrobacteraceae bacterium]